MKISTEVCRQDLISPKRVTSEHKSRLLNSVQNCEVMQFLCPLDSGQVLYFIKDKRENPDGSEHDWEEQLHK